MRLIRFSLTASGIVAIGALIYSGATSAGEIKASAKGKAPASYQIVSASVALDKNVATFRMHVGGNAGARKPSKTGKFPSSGVHAYVWPTSLDSAVVGFEPKAGILAFAVTIHPDFNDDPFFENQGGKWHSHWVVLAKDAACPGGGLKVVDIPKDAKPRLPKTWPGVPLLIDSPGWRPRISRDTIEVRVPFEAEANIKGASFDGVTAGLRVDANLHAPLLCVADVFHVASGDLSLPGKID